MIDGVSLGIKSDKELHAEALEAIVAAEQAKQPVIVELAAHVKKAFEDAKSHRSTEGIDDRILASRRLSAGEYTPEELSRIQATGGSQLFFNITAPKCEAFVAWLQDVFTPVGEKVWDLAPTPIPSLPEGDASAIVEQIVAQFSQMPEGTVDPAQIKQATQALYDQQMIRLRDSAKQRTERMSKKIEDQVAEGGMMLALGEFIEDLSVYPSAILKGPMIQVRKRLSWEDGKVTVKEESVPTWSVVDPFNFFPGPNIRNVDEGYICEVSQYTKSDLSKMKGMPGWKDDAIDAIIGMSETKSAIYSSTGDVLDDSELARLENRDVTDNSGMADGSVEAVEYWGSVPGHMLHEWGMDKKDVPDAFAYYEINAILIGNLVVRSVLNPDPLGRRPYYVTSFVKNKNSVWGLKSLPEKMQDVQQGVNGAQRTLMNNLAIASGPQVVVDMATISPSDVPYVRQLFPWKAWCVDGSKVTGSGHQPVSFFQPQSNSNELIEVTKYFEDKADDRTLIPRYVTGDGSMGGAGQTASGLSMLMSAASRGIKRVIRNVDTDIIRPLIERIYTWNMMTLDDDTLKGDVQIVPKGVLAALVREQTQLRRQEFLNSTANSPLAQQIMGIRGYANLLREVAKGLDIPIDKIVPSEEEIASMESTAREPSTSQQQKQKQQTGNEQR